MIIKGKPIADTILTELKKTVQEKQLHPHLAILLAGNDPASRVYIKYKDKAATNADIKISVYEFTETDQDAAIRKIEQLNKDHDTHGIIVQLPIYPNWVTDNLVYAVALAKDVDGFRQDSPFIPATAEGTWEMIKEFARIEGYKTAEDFLRNKNIVILGKGRTAGKPARDLLTEKGFQTTLIDSRTTNPDKILNEADLIISATGKKHIINDSNTKEGAYVIGIGVGKEVIDGEEKLFGDIDLHSIEHKAKLICPTIGGIGPLTIACLLRNVVKSAEHA
jgi:methylenetetrahydrofolate dehydrogenase (NADP+)/methenyltetrahydrofolate cyclohydrolase